MKKISGFLFVALMFSVVLGVTSCGKDGDAGPAGAAGAAGPKGDNGPKGDQGAPGAANVIYSEWLDVEYGVDSSAGIYFVDIDADKITADVLNTGFVRVYINFGTPAAPAVVSVPYAEESGVYIKDYLLEGIIELVSNADASTVADNNGAKRRQVRYVIIPGGTAARTAKSAIDWNDYAKVKAYMGWKN
jgi:hypothetical protein